MEWSFLSGGNKPSCYNPLPFNSPEPNNSKVLAPISHWRAAHELFVLLTCVFLRGWPGISLYIWAAARTWCICPIEMTREHKTNRTTKMKERKTESENKNIQTPMDLSTGLSRVRKVHTDAVCEIPVIPCFLKRAYLSNKGISTLKGSTKGAWCIEEHTVWSHHDAARQLVQ